MITVNDHLRIGAMTAARVPEGFDDRPYDRFSVTPLSPTIGAVLGGVDLGADIDDELHAELRRALLEWKVVFFRDQDITRDQQRDFALSWGELERHPFYAYVQPDQPHDEVVRLAKDAASPGVENVWHADLTWHTRPSFGAVLRAVEVPPVGGDTLWADAAAAYDDLPEELQEQIEGLEAVHDWRRTFGLAMPPEERDRLSEHFPLVQHPVVRIHPETGRRTLFVNAIFTSHLVDVDPVESERILTALYQQMHRPEFQCRFRWEPGSVAFWDNRSTQHYASSDYAPAPRVMERISIAGDVPVGST